MLPHEELFHQLQDVATLTALIGQTEDLHLDCKTWPARDDDAQRVLAKAVCGFANAEGGVIVIGLEAKPGAGKADPDLISKAVPVADAIAVKSRIENLVGQLVEPPPEGVKLAAVLASPGSKEGFVVVSVPPTDGLPCRSRKHRDFYQRISAGTYPMEYFQIADLFGRRRRPVLSLYLEAGRIELQGERYLRALLVGLENRGRAVAKFPSLRLKVAGFTIDGSRQFGLPQRPSFSRYTVFGGGVDHVIYPGTVLTVARLEQPVSRSQVPWLDTAGMPEAVYFDELTVSAQIAADEIPTIEDAKTVAADVLSLLPFR